MHVTPITAQHRDEVLRLTAKAMLRLAVAKPQQCHTFQPLTFTQQVHGCAKRETHLSQFLTAQWQLPVLPETQHRCLGTAIEQYKFIAIVRMATGWNFTLDGKWEARAFESSFVGFQPDFRCRKDTKLHKAAN